MGRRRRRNPRPMSGATVLYRSVSLPEFQHVMETGKFRGGANGFNPYDKRKFVFFADAVDDELVFQGEDIDRQAEYALSDDPIHRDYADLRRDADNDTLSLQARQKAYHASTKLQERYRARLGRMIQTIRRKLSKLPMTSVIFETIPIVGAEVFESGETGFGEREYGFLSNEVNIYDVAFVHLVRRGKVIGTITVPEARELARSLEGKLW